MAHHSIVKKLFRTLTRVIPQCGMVSQAVAFNMFLAFFSILLVVLGLMSSSLKGRNGHELGLRLSAILPPGSWQLVSEFLLRREVNPWNWVLLGWAGTLLVGLQAMKLIMEGIHLIYGDRGRHSFLTRSGLLLFCVSLVAWLLAVALSVFGRPLRQWMTRELGQFSVGSGLLDRRASGLGNGPGEIRPGLDLSGCAPSADDMDVRSARSGCGDSSLVGRRTCCLEFTSSRCSLGLFTEGWPRQSA